MTAAANQYGDELRNSKNEISDLKRAIARLQNQIQAAKAQVSAKFIEYKISLKSTC